MTDAPVSPDMEHLTEISLGALLTIEDDESLWDAWQLMFLSGRRHLVIIDGEGRYLGVVADRAILAELPLTEERLAERTVSEVMATPAALHPDDSPRAAAQRMVEASVEAVPIVDAAGRLQGMVTTSDLTRWLAGH
jgi:CBS domain-containing protein